MTFKPVVTHVEENQKFAWLGSALLGGFKGAHYFVLEKTEDNKVKLTHGERFLGWLVWLILPLIRKQTLAGFIGMNKAFKARVESL